VIAPGRVPRLILPRKLKEEAKEEEKEKARRETLGLPFCSLAS
jgi:hypothetical protein